MKKKLNRMLDEIKTNIYCLLLENNKYYIGKANNVQRRFRKHCTGNGSLWTKLHKPVKILEVFEEVSPFMEDRYVKEYMYRYGIDNVRGGSYIKEDLTPCQVHNLKREIWMATDKCFECGEYHYCRDCKNIVVPRSTVLLLGLIVAGLIMIFLFSSFGVTEKTPRNFNFWFQC